MPERERRRRNVCKQVEKKMWQLVSCVAAAVAPPVVVASVPTLVPVPELARVTATGAHSSQNLNI